MPLAGAATLVDVLRGAIVFDVAEIEDVVLVKTDGFPTYHFAVVVDDHLMGITHVLRADEWIPSAPIQLQLYAAFGWAEPVWAHLPLVLNPDGGGKMSKRKTIGPDGQPLEQMTLVREYQAAGYLPEAMFNFLARLGWSYSGEDEVFTREQALERFRLEDVKPSPAAWNPEKLDWLNGVYIRALEPADLAARLMPFFERAGLAADAARVRAVVPLIQPRIETLADAPALVDFLWADAVAPAVDEMVPKGLDAAGAAELLAAADAALGGLEAWDHAGIEAALRAVAADRGLKAGAAFQPIRLAVTGRSVAPPLFETLEVLGRDATHARIAAARAAGRGGGSGGSGPGAGIRARRVTPVPPPPPIDLRSDTVTRPTPAMRAAMAAADVGDDVFGEDPTVNRLEALAAEWVGKAAGLFVASGTQGNLAALLATCGRGDEVILGDQSHTFVYEAGGSAAVGGIHPRPVATRPDGTLDVEVIEAAVRPDNVHFPPTRLICLENTHNRCGGAALAPAYMAEVRAAADRHGLAIHLDGARLFNAAAALGVAAADLARDADSVTFCLSKGSRRRWGACCAARGASWIGRVGRASCSAAACGRRASSRRRASWRWRRWSTGSWTTMPTPAGLPTAWRGCRASWWTRSGWRPTS